MHRTKKWEFVRQEAQRLAALGLLASEIALRLQVHKSTVGRWIEAGQLTLSKPPLANPVRAKQSPEEWAAAVREAYQLDATDEQLVTLAQQALGVSLDPNVSPSVQMTAAGRFQTLVRQLDLPARAAEQEHADLTKEPERPRNPPVARRPGFDPRGLLAAAK